MADLQKTVNVKPTISSVGNPTAQSVDYASGIASLGERAKTFVLDKKKDKLASDLESLSDPSLVRSISDTFLSSKKEFERLKHGLAQGALSQTHVNIATEALLKEAIGNMPALAPELRRYAATELGFDPTGSALRAAIGATIPKEEEKNPVLKKIEDTAEAFAATTGGDPATIRRLMGQNLLLVEESDLVTRQAVLGNANADKIAQKTAQESQAHISDFTADIVELVNTNQLTNPGQVKVQMLARQQAHRQALMDRFNKAGIRLDQTELKKHMDNVDAQWASIQQIVDTGNFAEITSTNVKGLTNAMTIAAYDVWGDVAMANLAGGQAAVDHMLLTLDKFNSPEQLALLKQTDPALKRFLNTQDDLYRLGAAGFMNVMGYKPQFSENQLQVPTLGGNNSNTSGIPEPVLQNMSDRVFYDLTTKGNLTPEERHRVLNYAKGHGQTYKVLGAYFQNGARTNATPEEVQFITQTFEEEYPQLVSRLAAEVASSGDWSVEIHNGQVRVNTPTSYQIPSGGPGSRSAPVTNLPSVHLSSTVESDLKRLNSFDKGVKNGWAADFGKSPDTFLQETADMINGEIDKIKTTQGDLNAAITAFEQNPTPENLEAIRAIDPDIIAEAERLSSSSSTGRESSRSGGGSNAK